MTAAQGGGKKGEGWSQRETWATDNSFPCWVWNLLQRQSRQPLEGYRWDRGLIFLPFLCTINCTHSLDQLSLRWGRWLGINAFSQWDKPTSSTFPFDDAVSAASIPYFISSSSKHQCSICPLLGFTSRMELLIWNSVPTVPPEHTTLTSGIDYGPT